MEKNGPDVESQPLHDLKNPTQKTEDERNNQPRKMNKVAIGTLVVVAVAAFIGICVGVYIYTQQTDPDISPDMLIEGKEIKFEKMVPENSADVYKFKAYHKSDNSPVMYGEFLKKLQSRDIDYIDDFNKVLKDGSPEFDAYFFETPGTTQETSENQQFEFILKKTSFDRFTNRQTYMDYFGECKINDENSPNLSTDFLNLSGDSKLIAPCPPFKNERKFDKYYDHLAAFSRNVEDEKVHDLWSRTGNQMIKRLGNGKKQWLSTNGGAVAWLHIRIDPKPKYYTFFPYKA